MAIISLNKIYKAQRRTKIIWAVLLLLISFACFELIISRNPGRAKAYTISAPGTIINSTYRQGGTGTPVSLAGQDVTIGGGVIITMSGTNNFNSLLISGGSKVTHEALVSTTNVDFSPSPNFVLTPTGEAKKVDLNIVGDLTLDTGGKIDVTGMGFPGGFVAKSSDHTITDGSGPGGSVSYNHDDHASTGGASFIGRGGNSSQARPAGSVYPQAGTPYTSTNIKFGSGAGGTRSWNSNQCYGTGGSGGGRIYIVASNIVFKSTASYISANGGDGVVTQHNNCGASSGGGSGGTVYIKTTGGISYSNIISGWSVFSVAGGLRGMQPVPATLAVGTINNTTGYIFYNINAKGGNYGYDDSNHVRGGVGGGGNIILDVPVYQGASSVKITKNLSPIRRDTGAGCNMTTGVGCSDSFNPYALQKGDIIWVSLTVTGVTGTYFLADPWLKVTEGSSPTPAHQCANPDNFSTTPSPFEITDPIKWQLTSDGTVTYQCTVN